MLTLVFLAAIRFMNTKFGRYSSATSLAVMSAWLYAIDGSQGNNKRLFTQRLYALNQAVEHSAFSKVNETRLVANLPTGLLNLRNTCYMNSILQSLFCVKGYSDSVRNGTWTFKADSVGWELKKLFESMHTASTQEMKMAISPRQLAIKLQIDISQQEDAEELMLKILNEVDDSCVPAAKGKKKSASSKALQKIKPSAAFEMELEQTIRCLKFDHASSTKTLTNFDLSVDIKGHPDVYKAIEAHFVPEQLVGDNRYRCAQHGLQDAEKSYTISKFPRVLAVHLKRFSFDPATYSMKKIIDPMDIPVELNLRAFATQTPVDKTAGIYSLSAIVVHEGSLDVGHYYAFAKIPLSVYEKGAARAAGVYSSDRYVWVKLNDQSVSMVTEEEVLQVARGLRRARTTNTVFQRLMDNDTSTNAYLLFYSQLD